MKIAVIQITFNDGYKFKEWCGWYEEFKNEIDTHIIVDNGSKPDVKLEELKFKEAGRLHNVEPAYFRSREN